MASKSFEFLREDVGYPYVRLNMTITDTARTASNVTLSLQIKIDINGWTAQANYGGYLHVACGGTDYLNITYINPAGGGTTSPYGKYATIYNKTHTITVPASSGSESVQLSVYSTSGRNDWTSFIWNVPSANTKITIPKGTIYASSVTVSPESLNLVTNGTNTGTLSAKVAPSNVTTKGVNWTTSNSNVATVDSSGKVTAKGNGSCTITATAKDGSGKKDTCSVTVTTAVTSVSLNKSSVTLTNAGSTDTITATVNPSSASNKNVTWSTSNSSVAVCNGSGDGNRTGTIIANGAGTCTITVTTVDGGKTASCSVTVRVAAGGVSLDRTELNLVCNRTNTHKLNATVSPSNATNKNVTWSSNNTGVATVDSNGNVTAKGNGSCTITVTTSDGGYKAYCTVNVSTAVDGVSLNKTSLTFKRNRGSAPSQKLTATINPGTANNKNVSWSSNNTGVATVDANGNVNAVGNGTCTITVTTSDESHKAYCTVNVTTAASEISIHPTTATLTCNSSNNSIQLTASVGPSDATDRTYKWELGDSTGLVTVDSSGLVVANKNTKNGTCTVRVRANDTTNTLVATCTITVIVAVTNIKLEITDGNANDLIASTERPDLGVRTLKATVTPANADVKTLNWHSNNKENAKLDIYLSEPDANGVSYNKITAVKGGSYNIIAENTNSGKSDTLNFWVIDDKGPVGTLVCIPDIPKFEQEKCRRVDHQDKFGIVIDGEYTNEIKVDGNDTTNVKLDDKKIWFKSINETGKPITCKNFDKPGDTNTNTSGGCAEVSHCGNLFETALSSDSPISPTQIVLSYTYRTLIGSNNKPAEIMLFGRNSGGSWVNLTPQLTNNQITSVGAVSNHYMTCETKNFFTQFKIGIFPKSDNFITDCNLTNVKITKYKKDASGTYNF